MPPNLAEVGEWLRKAGHDRTMADLALGHKPPVTDSAAFHSQQIVEKLLKAYLVFWETPFQKIHDLEELIELCARHDPAFEGLRDRVGALTPFAVRFRYPGPVDPSIEQARSAFATAEEVVAFLKDRIPLELWSAEGGEGSDGAEWDEGAP